MQLVIVLCLAAAAAAAPQGIDERNAETITYENELREDQSYDYLFETSNNINVEESGISYPGAEPETGNYVMSGSYEFEHPDGTVHYVSYIADENGYRPESDRIPVFTGRVNIQDV